MDARTRILEKSNELFHRHGIRRVTMDDIATQCGMSKKTIYQYFKDKNELVDAFTVEKLEENKQTCVLDKQRAENAIHEIFLAMDMVQEMFDTLHPSLLHDLEKYHHNSYLKFRKYKEEYLYNVIKQNIEWGISNGLYREDINVPVMSRFRLESILLPFNLDLFPESRYDITSIQREITDHFIFGLATPTGRKYIQKYKNQRSINKNANV